jgi:hypothetical protein
MTILPGHLVHFHRPENGDDAVFALAVEGLESGLYETLVDDHLFRSGFVGAGEHAKRLPLVIMGSGLIPGDTTQEADLVDDVLSILRAPRLDEMAANRARDAMRHAIHSIPAPSDGRPQKSVVAQAPFGREPLSMSRCDPHRDERHDAIFDELLPPMAQVVVSRRDDMAEVHVVALATSQKADDPANPMATMRTIKELRLRPIAQDAVAFDANVPFDATVRASRRTRKGGSKS